MGKDSDIYELIMSVAKNHQHIKGVYLNGSRANPFVWDDDYQDFDIVFVVDKLATIIDDNKWLDQFGDILIKQIPKEELLYSVNEDAWYSIILLLSNLQRIDLTFVEIGRLDTYIKDHHFIRLLLDKGYHLPNIDEPKDDNYWIKEPNQQLLSECIDEFYLMALNVMKGIGRKHLIYAMDYFDICRKMLLLMWSWDKSEKYHFEINMGKHLKYLHNYLNMDEQAILRCCYPKFKEREIQQALITMMEYFDELAEIVSDKLEFTYKKQIFHTIKMYIKTLTY